MARPHRDGSEKAVIVSISVTPRMKQYMLDKRISPSKLFAEFFYKCVDNNCEVSPNDSGAVTREKEIKAILEYFKQVCVDALKPSENYHEQIRKRDEICNNILKKFPELTKANLFDYAERGSFYTVKEEPKSEGVNEV